MNETDKLVKSIYDNVDKVDLEHTSKETIEKIVIEIRRKGEEKLISDVLPIVENFLNEKNKWKFCPLKQIILLPLKDINQ